MCLPHSSGIEVSVPASAPVCGVPVLWGFPPGTWVFSPSPDACRRLIGTFKSCECVCPVMCWHPLQSIIGAENECMENP